MWLALKPSLMSQHAADIQWLVAHLHMSHHPLAHKLAVVNTMQGRARAICLDVTAKEQKTRGIRQALSNGCPSRMLHTA